MQGYENYINYIEEGLIQQLDTELSGTSKKLKTYIYPTFLTLANQKGTYAIPNNHPTPDAIPRPICRPRSTASPALFPSPYSASEYGRKTAPRRS